MKREHAFIQEVEAFGAHERIWIVWTEVQRIVFDLSELGEGSLGASFLIHPDRKLAAQCAVPRALGREPSF